MQELIETHPGRWILVAGQRSIRHTMLTFIARLAANGPVRVLDGGNQFNAYQVARQVRGRSEILERISISRAFTCYQVLTALEKAESQPGPLIILDLLSTFYDQNVAFTERRRLLERCLPQITRLTTQAGGAVSIHPPAVPTPEANTFYGMLKTATSETWIQDAPETAPEAWRLF